MKLEKTLTLAVGILTIASFDASAATVSTFAQSGGLCSSSFASTGVVTSSCGSFVGGDGIDARAAFGDIGLRSQVAGPSNGGSFDEDADRWRGSAAFNDVLSFSVPSGTFRLFTDIAVTLIEHVTGEFAGSDFSAGRNVFSVRVGDTTIFQRSHEYQNGSSSLAELTYVDDFGSAGLGFFDIAFSGGSLDLSVSMSSEAICGAQHRGNIVTGKVGSCLLGVDAFNSLRLVGSSVFDASGGNLENGFLSAESGFNYRIGVQRHNPSPIPLPPSLFFLLGGILFLVNWRRTAIGGFGRD